MFSRRTFGYRRTKQGATVRCCHEKYLREDIPCGINFCLNCSYFSDIPDQSSPLISSKENYSGMICIVDYRVVLEQIAFLESPSVVDFVFPQTIVSFLKNHHTGLYRRLITCFETKSKGFYQFLNEFHVGVQPTPTSTGDSAEYLSGGLPFFNDHVVILE